LNFIELTIVDPRSYLFVGIRCSVLRYCTDTRDYSRNDDRESDLCDGLAAWIDFACGARGWYVYFY
jgi:hypothetical protein